MKTLVRACETTVHENYELIVDKELIADVQECVDKDFNLPEGALVVDEEMIVAVFERNTERVYDEDHIGFTYHEPKCGGIEVMLFDYIWDILDEMIWEGDPWTSNSSTDYWEDSVEG